MMSDKNKSAKDEIILKTKILDCLPSFSDIAFIELPFFAALDVMFCFDSYLPFPRLSFV